jgi:iron(III) transport system permease protein
VALTLVFVFLEARVQRRARYYQHQNGAARTLRPVSLGRWKIPALLFCGTVMVFSLVLPAGVLAYWLVRGMQAGEMIGDVWRAAGNSLLVSGLGAVVAIAVALPLAVLMVRHASSSTRLVERITYAAFALPGIVVALTLVFFGATYAPMLYQTLPMLLFAYLILFLPQALGAVRSSLLQIHPSLEEAAASLGKRPSQIFATITLPLLRPGIIAGACLVFLTAMKELPATLILAPIGMKTLATSIWSAVSEAFFAQAAAPALLLILMSSLPMAFFILRERGGSE